METMGQQFRAARERKGMTLSRAAALTRIKIQHLEMMERDDFSAMPAPAYAKGFIRMYATFLGLDSVPLVQEYNDVHLATAPKVESRPDRRVVAPAPESAPKPAPRKSGEDANAATAPRRPTRIRPALDVDKALRALQGFGPVAQAWFPRIVVASVILLAVVLVGRCAARTASAPREEPTGTRRMDAGAIMKEPPVRFLDIPAAQQETP